MLCPYIDKLIEDNMNRYNKVTKDGFYFRNIDMKRFDRELETFYKMSTAGFADNLFYADIPFEEFRSLYIKSKGMINSDFFKIIMFEGREAGFFYSSPDYTRYFETLDLNFLINRARLYLGRNRSKGLVLKSTAVLPEYRSKGVQCAMSYAEAIEAKSKGYEYLIGAFCYVESCSVRPMKMFSRDNIYELYTIGI
jgi:predicted GNAT family acetyltransferase